MDQTLETKVENTTEKSSVVTVTLKKPIDIDGEELKKVTLDFDKMTGADIIKIDNELRREGMAFDDLWNQKVVLKLASYASGVNEFQLQRLHPGDFLEVQMQTRNFFIRW